MSDEMTVKSSGHNRPTHYIRGNSNFCL